MALRLLEDGYDVIVVDNLSRGYLGSIRALQREAVALEKGSLTFIRADIAIVEVMQALLTATLPDVVLHYAAVTCNGCSPKHPLNYYQHAASNTILLLQAMQHVYIR